MFIHNLTVALRNLTKYKTQSIVSILGLAAGFACFSLTAMWIRYENSFDNFHPKGDRIYRIVLEDKESEDGYYGFLPDPVAAYLKANFPEVEEASLYYNDRCEVTLEKENKRYSSVWVDAIDSALIKMFDLPQHLIKDLIPTQAGKTPIAILQEVADYYTEKGKQPIGLQGLDRQEKMFEVRGVFDKWERTDFRLTGLVYNFDQSSRWDQSSRYVYVLLKEGADGKAFMKKIRELKIDAMKMKRTGNALIAVPLHDMHKEMPSDQSAGRTNNQHIRIFALAGILVIICALFNYLVLFITRLKMRGRELALRKVNGASNVSLMGTLLFEFGLVLLIALFVGEYMIKFSLPFFTEVSRANMQPIEIYKETLLFAAILYLITILLCTFPIYYFRRKTMLVHLLGKDQTGIKNLFQKTVLVSQIIMSTIMIFATAILYLQINYLQNQNLGLNPHNIVNLRTSQAQIDLSPFAGKFETLPFVEQVLTNASDFFPCRYGYTGTKIESDNLGETSKYILRSFADYRLFDMAEIKLLEGRIYRPEEIEPVVINESARKLLTQKDVIGSMINGHQIIGVVADSYRASPLLPATPTMFQNIIELDRLNAIYARSSTPKIVTIKLKEGTNSKNEQNNEVWKRINEFVQKEYPHEYVFFEKWEELYQRMYLTSEKNLAKLFSIVSIICLLISIFGIYSLASLTCEQRRKEIAIRKINGATMKDILNLFFKEFFILLGIAIVIAFPIGYYVMRLWLEQYSRQVPMGPLLFLGIALALAIVIVLTIIFRVWRAASANPAQIIKENN